MRRFVLMAMLTFSIFMTSNTGFSCYDDRECFACTSAGGMILSAVMVGGTIACAVGAGVATKKACDPYSDFNETITENVEYSCQVCTHCCDRKPAQSCRPHYEDSTCSHELVYCQSVNGSRIDSQYHRDWPTTLNWIIATSVVAPATLVVIGLTALSLGVYNRLGGDSVDRGVIPDSRTNEI